ncbi:MAG: hypothetical protein ACYTDX_01380 [Planctomycetota bacterium]|jgi:hypothetical protein
MNKQVDELRREVAKLKRLIVAGVVIMLSASVIAGAAGANSERVVRAERLEICDSDSSSARPVMIVGVHGESRGVFFRGEDGKYSSRFAVDEGPLPRIVVGNEKGRLLLDSASMEITQGERSIVLVPSITGASRVTLTGKKESVVLALDAGGRPSISLVGPDGSTVEQLPR